MSKNDKERIVFDAVLGNPPYQVTKGGTKNVNVWQHFVKVANLCGAKWVSMIHPGRWVVAKQQMQSIKEDLIENNLEKFLYYPNSTDVFTDVAVEGGITITNFKKDYKGDIEIYVNDKKHPKPFTKTSAVYNEYEEEIATKLKDKYDKNMEQRKYGIMSFESCFGYEKKVHSSKLTKDKSKLKNPVAIWANKDQKGKSGRYEWWYIDKSILTKLPTNIDLLKTRKILISVTGHSLKEGKGANNIFNGDPQLLEKNSVAIGYIFIPQNDTDYELKLIQSLFCTKTARFLMSLTQKDLYVRGFENIPDYTYFINDMKDPKYNNKMFENKLGLLTDEYFYKKFNFSKELIDYIESHISPKELV